MSPDLRHHVKDPSSTSNWVTPQKYPEAEAGESRANRAGRAAPPGPRADTPRADREGQPVYNPCPPLFRVSQQRLIVWSLASDRRGAGHGRTAGLGRNTRVGPGGGICKINIYGGDAFFGVT